MKKSPKSTWKRNLFVPYCRREEFLSYEKKEMLFPNLLFNYIIFNFRKLLCLKKKSNYRNFCILMGKKVRLCFTEQLRRLSWLQWQFYKFWCNSLTNCPIVGTGRYIYGHTQSYSRQRGRFCGSTLYVTGQ